MMAMSDGFNHNYDETDLTRDRAREQGTHLDEAAGSNLRRSRTRLHSTRGRGALSEAIGAAVEEAMEGLERAQRQLRRHMDDMADGLDQMNRNHRANDDRIAEGLRALGGSGAAPSSPQGRGERLALPAAPTRSALPPGNAELSLDQVRRMRDKRRRWSSGEDHVREMYGGGPERHYPVPTNQDPVYPVTATGGRKVDVPVDLPDGRTLAVEVKTYQQYRMVETAPGQHTPQHVEVPLSSHIKEQIHKDLALRQQDPGYDPRWTFLHAGPSSELRDYLQQAGIVFVEHK
jgi:hypothetical protein